MLRHAPTQSSSNERNGSPLNIRFSDQFFSAKMAGLLRWPHTYKCYSENLSTNLKRTPFSQPFNEYIGLVVLHNFISSTDLCLSVPIYASFLSYTSLRFHSSFFLFCIFVLDINTFSPTYPKQPRLTAPPPFRIQILDIFYALLQPLASPPPVCCLTTSVYTVGWESNSIGR